MPQAGCLKDIVPTEIEAGEQIRRWFTDDEEGRRRLEFYASPHDWFTLLGPSRHGWFVEVDGHAVGLIDMEVDGERGYIAYYIAPQHRGLGYGTEAIRLMTEHARALGLAVLEGSVEPDNAPSIAALRRAGFVFGELDEEEMFPVELVL